jgi:curved DNA-binding protein CbpA
MGPLPGSHYEILGLEPNASFEQIERAYRYHIAIYSETSLATYSLLDPAERQVARAQIQAAYDTLKDGLRRRAYDIGLGLFPDPAAPPPPPPAGGDPSAAPERPEPAAPVRVAALSDPVTGAALRRFREQSGISLHQIAERSKIGIRSLQHIEEDRYPELPARVYLRGFLQEYARVLGLDPARTADAYLAALPKTIGR